MKPFSAIGSVLYLVRDSYRIPLLSRLMPWPYNGFYMNRFYRGNLLKKGSIQSE